GHRNLFEKVYQLVKSFALKGKLKLVNQCQDGHGSILDFGCGTGDFLMQTQTNSWKSYGYEPNEKARELAKSKGLCLIDDLNDVDDHFFDVITLWHVFEHLSDPEESIVNFKRILKPNGTLIIAVPNYKSYDAQYYGKFWAAYDVPRHLWHFSRKSFEILSDNQNMKVKKVLPMWWDSFYVSLLSEKYKKGRMNPIRAIWIGLKSNLYGKRNHEFSSHIYIINNI
ncbi:MAG: class I SAM-dependent methyltransferase, partial [Flavobacterium sp.]